MWCQPRDGGAGAARSGRAAATALHREGVRTGLFDLGSAAITELAAILDPSGASAAAIGALGDVVLSDLSQYIAITKGGVKSEQSMHFWFDQNLRAFRFVYRIGGMPWLSAPIGRKNGSNTLSHFVTLEAR